MSIKSTAAKAKKRLSDFNKKVASDAKKAANKLKRKPKAKPGPVAKFAIAFALVLCASLMWAQVKPAAPATPASDKFEITADFSTLDQNVQFNNLRWNWKLGGDLSGVWWPQGMPSWAGIEADGRLYSQPGASKSGTVFLAYIG